MAGPSRPRDQEFLPQADPEPVSSGLGVADTIAVGFTAVGSAHRVIAVRQKRSKTLDLSATRLGLNHVDAAANRALVRGRSVRS